MTNVTKILISIYKRTLSQYLLENSLESSCYKLLDAKDAICLSMTCHKYYNVFDYYRADIFVIILLIRLKMITKLDVLDVI